MAVDFSKHRGSFQHQRLNSFLCLISGREFLTERITSVSMNTPNFNVDSSIGNRRGTEDYHPGFLSLNSINIKFKEDIDGTVLQELMRWKFSDDILSGDRRSIQNTNGTYNYPSEYKSDITVQAVGAGGVVGLTTIYKGAFPTSTSVTGYDYGSNSHMTLTQTFSVDTFEIVNNNQATAQQGTNQNRSSV